MRSLLSCSKAAAVVSLAIFLGSPCAVAQSGSGGSGLKPSTVQLVMAAPVISATVEPAEVREARPFKVKVFFELGPKDTDPKTTPGRLIVSHGGKSATIAVPKLTQGEKFAKSVELVAGSAGADGKQLVDVQYYSDATQPGVDPEFPQSTAAIGSCTAEIRIRAQFYVTLDRMNVVETRSSLRDVDYIWFGSTLGGGEMKKTQKVIHDVGEAVHRVDLFAGPFEFVPDLKGPKLEFQSAFFIMNEGFEGSSEQKAKEAGDIITQIVGAGFGSAFGASGESGGESAGSWGNLAGFTVKLHDAMVNHGLGADGVVANEYVRVNASLVEERTRDGRAYEIKTPCYGLKSGDTTGNVKPSKYDVVLKFHRDATAYRIKVLTGDVEDAETDSHVFITLHGERGSTEEQELDDIQQNFQRGASETFTLVGKDVGRLTGIRIRHDNTFNDKSWWLDEVTVEDMHSNESASFVYKNWVSLTAGPRVIDVEIPRQ